MMMTTTTPVTDAKIIARARRLAGEAMERRRQAQARKGSGAG